MTEPHPALSRLAEVLAGISPRVIACSGGVDSLLLATVAHRESPATTTIAHTVTPAVPAQATARVVRYAQSQGWQLELIRSSEFDDERYLSNPVDRCYWCKHHLYDAIAELVTWAADGGPVVLSGANTDDLGEYRPGLKAAEEFAVRHPYLEAGLAKDDVRGIARHLGVDAAELPSSPCLASRLYTGTRVSADRLRAVELGEAAVTELTGVAVVRCRIREERVLVEVQEADRGLVTAAVLAEVGRVMHVAAPDLADPVLDPRAYKSGRSFLTVN